MPSASQRQMRRIAKDREFEMETGFFLTATSWAFFKTP